MEIETMGKVLVKAQFENYGDLYLVDQGRMIDADVRRLDVEDAMIDTGATGLSMPSRMIHQLGLIPRAIAP